MEIDWIRERMVTIDMKETIPTASAGVLMRRDAPNTVACDYLIHCFVEAVRRYDSAKLLRQSRPVLSDSNRTTNIDFLYKKNHV